MTTNRVVHFTIVRKSGKVADCRTTSPEINHFLDLVKLNRAYNTWLNYAYDLKIFFDVIRKLPQAVSRQDCVKFMKHEQRLGLSDATINRRLAAGQVFDGEMIIDRFVVHGGSLADEEVVSARVQERSG
jgi:site-specific recombinase XerC